MAGKRNEEKASCVGALRCAHEVQLSRCVNRFNRVSRLPRQGRGRSRDHRVHAAASSNDRLRVFHPLPSYLVIPYARAIRFQRGVARTTAVSLRQQAATELQAAKETIERLIMREGVA